MTTTTTTDDNVTYRGGCLCKGIAYEITGELGDFGCCHCHSCQKASGTAYTANVPVDRDHFRLVRGEALLREFESSPGKLRVFCSQCGSPLYAYVASTKEVLRLRLGSLDTRFEKKPRAHTFIDDQAAWEDLDGHAPRFPTWAPRSVLVQRGSRQP